MKNSITVMKFRRVGRGSEKFQKITMITFRPCLHDSNVVSLPFEFGSAEARLTNVVGTGVVTPEVGARIQNMWRQLGGVGSRISDKTTKSAQLKMKRVSSTTVAGILFIWTIKWTAWLGSFLFGEHNWSQCAQNGAAFRNSTTSKSHRRTGQLQHIHDRLD